MCVWRMGAGVERREERCVVWVCEEVRSVRRQEEWGEAGVCVWGGGR